MTLMSRSEVLKNRSVWHAIATLPPKETGKTVVQSKPSTFDVKQKRARDAIYDIMEQKRLNAEFAL